MDKEFGTKSYRCKKDLAWWLNLKAKDFTEEIIIDSLKWALSENRNKNLSIKELMKQFEYR